MLLKCFICTRVFEGSGSGSRNHILSPSQSSFMLSQILGLPPPDGDANADDSIHLKFRNVCYCSDCLEIVSALGSLMSELEILEQKVSTGKKNLIDRLRLSCFKFSEEINGPPGMLQELRNQIVAEIDKVGIKKESELCDVPNNSKNQTKRSSTKSKSTVSDKSPVRQRRSRNIVKSKSGYKATAKNEDFIDQNLDQAIDILDDFAETSEESISLEEEEAPNLSSVRKEQKLLKQRRKNKKTHKTRRVSRMTRESPNDSGSPEVKPKKSNKCEECGKVLSNHNKLKDHILTIHRGEGKFKCELCEFTCQIPVKLKRHIINRHSEARNYICDLCNKGFKRKDTLQAHKKIHEGKTLHECKLCSCKFTFATSLRKHIIDRDCLKSQSQLPPKK